jgi:hypothetical protein
MVRRRSPRGAVEQSLTGRAAGVKQIECHTLFTPLVSWRIENPLSIRTLGSAAAVDWRVDGLTPLSALGDHLRIDRAAIGDWGSYWREF